MIISITWYHNQHLPEKLIVAQLHGGLRYMSGQVEDLCL